MSERRLRLVYIAIVIVISGVEAWAILGDREGTFRIEGDVPRPLHQFGQGSRVRQAFLMQGAGLYQVRLLVTSPRRQELPVDWTLWRGMPDEPAAFAKAFESRQMLVLRAGRQWITLGVPRDGLSADRWYTIEITAASPQPSLPAAEQVAIHATADNPERGGVLWLDEVLQPGSLILGADRRGRTLFRRFEVEALPHLPSIFASAVFQLLVVITLHWAFWSVAWMLVKDGWVDVSDGRDS